MSMFGKGYAVFAALGILAALCLRAPALQVGLLADDWDHYAMSEGIFPVARSAFDHFDFVGSTGAEHAALQRAGRMPWWISADLHMAQLRPLSSALGHIDYAWFDGAHHPWRMHAHSLGWWVILVAGVACLLPMVLPLPAAWLGTVLYALDDAHILPVTWIANRSEVVANAFVVWALVLQVLAARCERERGREPERKDGDRARARARARLESGAHLLVVLALLAGEHSIPALAYLAAFQLCRRSLTLRTRIRRVVPLLALVLVFLIARRALGYGAAGLGIYVDPLSNPLRFLQACFEHLPLLFGDVVFGIAADWYPAGPPPHAWLSRVPLLPTGRDWPAFQTAVGWVALAAVATAALGLRRATDSARRSLLWLLLAAAASIVPMCASVAMGRLTLPAALGVDAAWAFCVYELARRALANRRPLTTVMAVAASVFVLGIQLAAAGTRAWREAKYYAGTSQIETEWVRLDGLDVRDRHVFTLTSGSAAQWVIPYVRHLYGLSMPASSTPLSAAFHDSHELIRTADSVLELRLPAGPSGARFAGSVYRSLNDPFHAGERIVTPNFEVTILAADGGEPTWLRFGFPASLDSDRYLFLHAGPQGFSPLSIPPVGSRVTLPPAIWPTPQPLAHASSTPRTAASSSNATLHE